MKKYLIISLIALIGLTFNACEDSTTDPVIAEKGSIAVSSTPAGATIFLDGVDTGEITPFTFDEKDVLAYQVSLQLENYADTSLFVDVLSGQTATADVILTPLVQNFSTPVRIYETTGTTAAQPSGLDLSSGNAYGTSDVTNRGNIDIYYFSSSDGSTFLVQSSHLNANMTRETFFKIGSGANLNDGVDSPIKNSSWVDSMSDEETNYVFLYDADGHYSKLRVTRGGGTGPGDPSYVDVTWIYSKAVDSVLF